MAVSEIVKLCLTKIAILFTCGGARVDLGSKKRHFFREWTHDAEIGKKCLLIRAVETPGAPNGGPSTDGGCMFPGPLSCSSLGGPRHKPVGTMAGDLSGSPLTKVLLLLPQLLFPFLLQRPDLYIFALQTETLLEYCLHL